jgi:hypothetical protein
MGPFYRQDLPATPVGTAQAGATEGSKGYRYLCSAAPLRPQFLEFCFEMSQPPLEDVALLVQPFDVLLSAHEAVPPPVARRPFPLAVT